ncbi:hypothetical protein K493DRAFT_301127 [Basidiobolus meristosporus CBS 931.73]|uniref:Uncharacterized protein n=1 Tax=Basidiobolus meristosporus CBS 931.73 TaxID=1314790 RepID=A0A1Y1YDD1_9FUNG|nr:hypothetical protein K493DRAFT_301127 [Basidiobolus meristosporus CBS 931.73]|eukprot:ORX96041.1 hypothetical protein K493DRAFT_301127 [Basidiobolus meristosporus CBS 931.73]
MLSKRFTKAFRRVSERTKANLPSTEKNYDPFQDDYELEDSGYGSYQRMEYQSSQDYPEKPTALVSPQESVKQLEATPLRRSPTVTPRNSGNFVRTMRLLSKQRKEGPQEHDTFDIFFPEQSICRARAIYFTTRIKTHFPVVIPTKTYVGEDPKTLDKLYHTIVDRFYTYSYVNSFMPNGEKRESILAKFEYEMQAFNPKYLEFKGGREAIFAVHYALNATFGDSLEVADKVALVQVARECIENCLESEERLNDTERQCMYNFHKLMSGQEWPDPNLLI